VKLRQFVCWILLAELTLGIFQGYVALWKSGGSQPETVYPYSAALLPPADQADLAEGIDVESPEALARLLEDFLS